MFRLETPCAACARIDEARCETKVIFCATSFKTGPRVLTPGSRYLCGPILFDYIRRAMPMANPPSLSNDEVYAASAYLLNLNGLIGPNDEMNSKTLPAVQMPNRDGFIIDDRPDTQAVRCMKDCK